MIHHPFGFSSLRRRMLCPASYRMEKDLPEETSEIAETGNFIHACIAESKFNHEGREATIEEKELIKKCLQFRSEVESGANIIEREIQLSVIGSNFEEILFGHADFVAVFLKESGMEQQAVYIDWKTGFKPVEEAEANIQGASTALAIFQKYGVPKVKVIFFNPRINQCTEFTYTDPQTLLKSIEEIINNCIKINPTFYSSQESCKYCRAKTICEHAIGMLQKIAEAKQELQVEHIHEISDPLVLSKWLDVWKLAKKIGASIEDKAKEYALQNGGKCGDYVIQKKSGTREITDTVKAYELGKEYGITQPDYLSICTPSATKYEKMFCEKLQTQAEAQGMKVTLKSLKEKFNDVMSPVISHKAETVSLVRIE